MTGIACGCMLGAMTAGSVDGAPETDQTPEALQPYVEVAAAAEAYRGDIAHTGWKTVHEMVPGTTLPRNAEATGGRATIDTAGGRPVIALDAAEQGFLRCLPKVSGQVAIEIEGRSVSARTCDLSLFLGGIASGPGFQFGAHWNQRNLIWTGPHKPAGTPDRFTSSDLPRKLLIQPNQWHTVRLEIQREPEPRLVASVDGQEIGEASLPADYDWTTERQPLIYAYSSTIQVRRAIVQKPAEQEARQLNQQQRWAKHFGDRTAGQVQQAVAELVDLLDHNAYDVREGAHQMLADFGPLAVEPMQATWPNATTEQRWRLRDLLTRAGVKVEMDEEEEEVAGE